jgi:hypothetical protein
MVTLIETTSGESTSSSYHGKLRQFGAMLDLHRQFRGKEQMLVVADTSKAEISAGGPAKFTHANQERWSVIAGGRDAAYETPLTTLGREIPEEFQEISEHRIQAALPDEVAAAVAQFVVLPDQYATLFPFIVGQLKHQDGKISRVNEVAASTVLLEFDRLPQELRRAFHYLEQKRVAKWIGVDEMEFALRLSRQTEEPEVGSLPVRPQLLTLAAIHHMQRVSRMSDEAVAQKVLEWNAQIARRLHSLANRHSLTVNNGVFTQQGTIYKHLPEEDRSYLGNYA